MKTTINQTLKKKLLTDPHPKCNAREFNLLNDRIFSSSEDIGLFLDTTDIGKKFELCTKIIKRMGYEANFPPAQAIINSLPEFEGVIRKKRTIQHPSRDHYIHICYLYLLGVYLFFYYPRFNEKLHETLTLIRKSDIRDEELGFVKNFISVWRYFVLYHDIAYCFEYFGLSGHDYSDNEKQINKNLEELFDTKNICKEIKKMLSLKTTAAIIALSKAIRADSFKTERLCEYLKMNQNGFSDMNSKKSFPEYLFNLEKKKITSLKYIKTGDDIKFFLSFFSKEDLFAVVKKNSDIVCIVENKDIFIKDTYRNTEYIRNISNSVVDLFEDEWFISFEEYKIEFYGVDLEEKYNKILESYDIPIADIRAWDFNIYRFSSIRDIAFEIYLECYKMKEVDSGVLEREICDKKCGEQLWEYLKKGFEETKKGKAIERGKLPEYIDTCIDKYVDNVKKACKKIIHENNKEKDTLIQQINRILQEDYYKNEQLISVYKIVLKNIESKWKVSVDNSKGLIDALNLLEPRAKDYICKSLKAATRSDMDISQIIDAYKPDYTKSDHGIESARIYILHFAIYRAIMNLISSDSDLRLIRLGFNIPNQKNIEQLKNVIDKKYIKDYDMISGQVAYAILVHNLYPKYFLRIEGIKTNIDENPFAYFCMMCDALQNWGRIYNINPMVEDYPSYLDSNMLDVKLNEYINLKYKTNNSKEIGDYVKSNTVSIDTYLENGSNYLRMKFI